MLASELGDQLGLDVGAAIAAGLDAGAALDSVGSAIDQRLVDGTWDDDDAAAVLELAWLGIRGVGGALRDARAIATSGTGIVSRLSRSDGGVPKLPVDAVDVGWSGVIGDRQAARQHHGRPWQALCLWSSEVIDDFAARGHPLSPGAAGENVTIRGLDWADVRPGVIVGLGTVRCEVSSYTLPCSKNAQWFVDGAFRLMHHEAGPVSRVYAVVLEPGTIATGDTVNIC